MEAENNTDPFRRSNEVENLCDRCEKPISSYEINCRQCLDIIEDEIKQREGERDE